MKMYKNNWTEKYKTFITDIHIETTENNSNALGRKHCKEVLVHINVNSFVCLFFTADLSAEYQLLV